MWRLSSANYLPLFLDSKQRKQFPRKNHALRPEGKTTTATDGTRVSNVHPFGADTNATRSECCKFPSSKRRPGEGLFTNGTILPPHSKPTLLLNDPNSRPFYSRLLQILSRTHLFINVSCQLQDWQITVSGSANSPREHRCLDLFVVLINPFEALRKKGPEKWPNVLIKPRRRPSRISQVQEGLVTVRTDLYSVLKTATFLLAVFVRLSFYTCSFGSCVYGLGSTG